jgi:hypothetical protein
MNWRDAVMVEFLEVATAGIDNDRGIEFHVTFHQVPSIPTDRIFEGICESAVA